MRSLVLFPLLFASISLAAQHNFWPQGPADTLVAYEQWASGWSETHEQPYWVAYVLTAEELDIPAQDRTGMGFRSDRSIRTKTPSDNDYKGSGYDRGHLSRAEYNKHSVDIYKECFMMSNISPQIGVNFNRTGGDWYSLETLEKEIAYALDSLYAVSGPIFQDTLGHIGKNSTITVPGYFYKAWLSPDAQHAIAIILRHDNVDDASLWDDAVTIDELEARTGFDFFPALPEEREGVLEVGYWQQLVTQTKE
ncbi:MAG: DNA/RNA non-specific endonuclease [Bacteroidota bacterium]